MSLLLKAQPVAEAVQARVRSAVEHIKSKSGSTPTLATVVVGDDPASHVYVRRKGEMCDLLGIGHKDHTFPADLPHAKLLDVIRELNGDNSVDGILVQQPLPRRSPGHDAKSHDSYSEAEVFNLIDPHKDVDCFSPHNVGLLVQGRGVLLPCTPAGILEILRHYNIPTAGKNALVIGRSDIVGKPMALLLLHGNATVTVAHSRTRDLNHLLSHADLVIAAVGKAGMISADLGHGLEWKKDCVVIDVGINRQPDGKILGDVDFEGVSRKVAAITPVPGGVGPMTIAMLMVNTARAAAMRRGLPWMETGL